MQKKLRFLCQDTQNNMKCSEKWFKKIPRWICACVGKDFNKFRELLKLLKD